MFATLDAWLIACCVVFVTAVLCSVLARVGLALWDVLTGQDMLDCLGEWEEKGEQE